MFPRDRPSTSRLLVLNPPDSPGGTRGNLGTPPGEVSDSRLGICVWPRREYVTAVGVVPAHRRGAGAVPSGRIAAASGSRTRCVSSGGFGCLPQPLRHTPSMRRKLCYRFPSRETRAGNLCQSFSACNLSRLQFTKTDQLHPRGHCLATCSCLSHHILEARAAFGR